MTTQPATTAAPRRRDKEPERFLDLADLRERGIYYHRTHLWSMIQKGRFPRPVKLGDSKFARRVWVASEVDTWIEARIAERERGAAA